jgi:hypothetical protein
MEVKKYLSTEFEKEGIFLGKDSAKTKTGLGIMLYEMDGLYYIGNWAANMRQGLGVMIDS